MANTNPIPKSIWVFKCLKCGSEYPYLPFGVLAPVCCGKPTVITKAKPEVD